jgi:hypothetical protein
MTACLAVTSVYILTRISGSGNREASADSRPHHGKLAGTLPRDGRDCETVLDNFRKARIDLEQPAADLQSDGAKSFDESWQNLLDAIQTKGKELQNVP